MKIPALLTALALACGVASAAPSSSNTDIDRTQSTKASADAPKGDGIVDKTKRAFHRLGDKIRGAGNKIANKTDKDKDRDGKTHATSKSNTRSMGAPGADTPDTARRDRMDDAYSNSKKSRQQ